MGCPYPLPSGDGGPVGRLFVRLYGWAMKPAVWVAFIITVNIVNALR